jgi:hypothetical protein
MEEWEMAPVPQGAQRSEDGHYWWDGNDWQEVPEDERVAPTDPASQTPASSDTDGTTGSGEMTMDELSQITSEEQLDDRSKVYFEPDYDMYPDDDSDAEGEDVLSDEPALDSTGGN